MFWGVSDQKVFCQFMNNLYKHLNLLFLLVCHVCVQRISFIIIIIWTNGAHETIVSEVIFNFIAFLLN